VPVTATPTVTFNKPVVAGSIAMTVSNGSTSVPGSVSYDATARTATFTPTSSLPNGTTFTVSVSAVDAAGNVMPAPYTWTFRSQYPPATAGLCPCGLWDDTAVPATITADDPDQVELGVRFSADYDGIVTGLRFYKGPSNTGTHTGSLWTASGQLLNTVTFTGESTAGWQSAQFATPTAITAGTQYVISYHTSGHYSYDTGGLAAPYVNAPLRSPAQASVFSYGATTFPTAGSSANYWVDPVFTIPPSTVPTPVAQEPGPGATNVSVASPVTVRFNAPLAPNTGTVALTTSSGAPVAGALTRPDASTLVFTPSAALADGASYTVTVSGVKTIAGTPMSGPATWTFQTASVSLCPCTLFSSTAVPGQVDSGDTGAVTVGVRFTASVDGYVNAVRFYKAASNTGAHTVSIWSSSGVRLATASATNETASGWQTVPLSQPLAVTAGTQYVAGYYAPVGHYSYQGSFFASDWVNGPLTAPAGTNGIYSYGSDTYPTHDGGGANYWVTPVYQAGTAPDTTPPSVTTVTPVAGSGHVDGTATATATFSEDVQNVTLQLTGPGGAVSGTSVYDPSTRRATFTPAAPLAHGVTFTASATATDLAGNAMASPYTWTFTTGADQVCPCTIFGTTDTPASPSVSDTGTGISLGTAFTSTVDAQATGVRFYKGAGNTGLHTGYLYNGAGTLLASVDFSNETASGWQTATFSSPVPLTAGSSYVIAYTSPTNTWSTTLAQFQSQAYASPPFTVPVSGGRYSYAGGFPASSSTSNYWVDVVATLPSSTPDTTPPVVSGVTATPGAGSATVSWTTDEAASSVVSYGTTTALGSTATGASGTSHSVALTGLGSTTTYYYRVTSVDASGNSTTSPVTTAAPSSFVTPDTAAPVVSAVTATATSGTAATVAWTTNESSTSVVSYGTTTALGSTATGASGTSHSVALTGLTDGTTYYYRVTSADASGNSTTSPVSTSAPSTFVTRDTTPPVVSAVAVTASGTTATVTWTTNESATTSLAYGTSTSLGQSATGTVGTSHTVSLSGLTPNTRYYYRVTSADAAGNSTTSPATTSSPASWTPTVAPVVFTTAADFATGSGAYVGSTGDGEVLATPTLGDEFSGSTLGTAWRTSAVQTGGTVTVSSGSAKVSGSRLYSNTTWSSGRSFASVATLGAGHSVGWGSIAAGSTTVRAAFVMTAAGGLTAAVTDGTRNTTTAVAGSFAGTPHEYRIDWATNSTATFDVDGTQGATSAFTPSVQLRYLALDPVLDTVALSVDWARIAPYATSTTFTSAVVDVGATVAWDNLTADTTLASGSTVTLRVRSGPNASPGSAWTAWTNVPAGGAITRTARYVQYGVVITTSGNRFVSSSVARVVLAFHVI